MKPTSVLSVGDWLSFKRCLQVMKWLLSQMVWKAVLTLSRGSRAQSAEAYPMEESHILMEMFRGKK